MNEGASCFSFAMTVKEDAPPITELLKKRLTAKGIENRPMLAGNMARQPGMNKFKYRTIGDLPNADYVMKNGIAIGCHQEVSSDDVGYVADTIEEFLCGL